MLLEVPCRSIRKERWKQDQQQRPFTCSPSLRPGCRTGEAAAFPRSSHLQLPLQQPPLHVSPQHILRSRVLEMDGTDKEALSGQPSTRALDAGRTKAVVFCP